MLLHDYVINMNYGRVHYRIYGLWTECALIEQELYVLFVCVPVCASLFANNESMAFIEIGKLLFAWPFGGHPCSRWIEFVIYWKLNPKNCVAHTKTFDENASNLAWVSSNQAKKRRKKRTTDCMLGTHLHTNDDDDADETSHRGEIKWTNNNIQIQIYMQYWNGIETIPSHPRHRWLWRDYANVMRIYKMFYTKYEKQSITRHGRITQFSNKLFT